MQLDNAIEMISHNITEAIVHRRKAVTAKAPWDEEYKSKLVRMTLGSEWLFDDKIKEVALQVDNKIIREASLKVTLHHADSLSKKAPPKQLQGARGSSYRKRNRFNQREKQGTPFSSQGDHQDQRDHRQNDSPQESYPRHYQNPNRSNYPPRGRGRGGPRGRYQRF